MPFVHYFYTLLLLCHVNANHSVGTFSMGLLLLDTTPKCGLRGQEEVLGGDKALTGEETDGVCMKCILHTYLINFLRQ